MAYVNSSPWQDAANFGGAVGDRLTQALIELPLKKQQYQQGLLQQVAELRQRQGQQQLTGQHYQAEEGHWKSQDKNSSDRVGAMLTGEKGRAMTESKKLAQEEDKMEETRRHNKEMESMAKGNLELHQEIAAGKYGDPSKAVAQIEKVLGNPMLQAQFSPEELDKLTVAYKNLKGQQTGVSGIGSALTNGPPGSAAPANSKRYKYDPQSGTLVPVQ